MNADAVEQWMLLMQSAIEVAIAAPEDVPPTAALCCLPASVVVRLRERLEDLGTDWRADCREFHRKVAELAEGAR
jgi:hypothetical protein